MINCKGCKFTPFYSSRNITGGTTISQRQAKALFEYTEYFSLEQYIGEPTRGRNILDLFFANDPDLLQR